MNHLNIKEIEVSKLLFDVKNPRMVEFSPKKNKSDKEIIEELWESMDLKELVISIQKNGFFRNDPLLIADENGKKVVIEGNRRLAAVKILLNPGDFAWDIPKISEKEKNEIKTLPCIEMSRKAAWKFIGFKHVNGPAKWGSYAKAKYIAQVHDLYEKDLDEIAVMIGDTHKTVRKLYRGLMVIEQAEKNTEFKRDDVSRAKLPFSHMYTALGYEGFSDFLNVKSEDIDTKDYVPKNKSKELEEVCLWLFGSKKSSIEPVVQSQNPDLRNLNSVLKSREATAYLRRHGNLAQALDITRPAENIFEEELFSAKGSLIKAKGFLAQGYNGSGQLLSLAGTIAELADDIYEEMERKKEPKKREKKKRVTE